MATNPTTYPKISFCTVCMGRLHHLRQTLPQNLADNADYPNLEWVILDYHSQDGLGDWIRTELADEWATGQIRYWRTTEPEAFHRCHSRNLLFRQAEGEVLVNLDADNFTGPGFAQFVGQQFADHPKAYLVPDTVRLEHLKDAVGRVCVRKEHFMAVRGYDEAMEGYGFEDHDLYARLDALGLQRLPIDREEFLRYLPHSDRERVENEARWRSMKTMYRLPRQKAGPERVLILGWDRQYVLSALESSEPSETGLWRERSGAVYLEQPNRAVRVQANGSRQWRWPWSMPALEAKEVVDEADRVRFFLRYFLNHNRQREVQNRQHTGEVNPQGFGRGQVTAITPGNSEQQRTCLLLECTPRHEECFPHWVQLLASLGYRVDIMAGVPEHVRDVMHLVEPGTYRFIDFVEPAAMRAQGYDFVVLNSLLYRNIFPLETVGGFPDVSFVEALGLPSITVIHSPMMWTRKRIVRTLTLQGPETYQEIYFIADGTFKKDDGAWQGCHWQEKGTQLLLTLDSRPLRFDQIADGQWRSENEGAWTLQELPEADYTPETHFSRERHQLVSLAHNGAQQLRDRFPEVQWQLPVYFGDVRPTQTPHGIVVPGMVDYFRKHYQALSKAAKAIRKLDQPVIIPGGARDPEALKRNADYQRLRQEVSASGLTEHVRFTGYLAYPEFFQTIANSRLILPLADEYMLGGAYRVKLCTAISYALAFGVPMVLNREVARWFDLEFMLLYKGDDLASGLNKYRQLSEEQYQELCRLTREKAAHFREHNRSVLRQLLERLPLPAAPVT